MKKLLLTAALSTLSYTALAETIEIKSCITEPAQITDMQFVSPHHAILATQSGDLYWFSGCNKPAELIGSLDVSNASWDAGLYSIATDWNFLWTHKLYAYYFSDSEIPQTELASFDIDPFKKDVTNKQVLMTFQQPYSNSNGGGMRFGPDGLLYLGVGDGGSYGDPHGHAQNVETLLGSVIRIDVNSPKSDGYEIPYGNLQEFIPGAQPEIFAYGVRNPWKLTFDFHGDLIIADVGESTIEEVNIIDRADINRKPINLGWNIKEGLECFNNSPDCTLTTLTDPVYQYTHGNEGNSITGGETFWFHGKEYYFFADFMTGNIGVLDLESPETPVVETHFENNNWVTFGKSYFGKVYVADYSKGLYEINLKP